MNTIKIKLPECINSRMEININPLSNDYQVVIRYKGCTYNTFDVSLPLAFEKVNQLIEKIETNRGGLQ